MTDRERAVVMAYTGVCMLSGNKFHIFRKYIDDIMGRPIWDHEIGLLADDIKEKSKADFMALCAEQEPCREQDDYENEIEDLHNRLDIAEYDKERLREEVTRLEERIKALEQETILDKIRAEIEQMPSELTADGRRMIRRGSVFRIVEKYKAGGTI